MWSVVATEKFNKKLEKLPKEVKRKFLKQMRLMQSDFRHPSLHTKKKAGGEWEARVDLHYRFSFAMEEEKLILLAIGMHDEGLGKK